MTLRHFRIFWISALSLLIIGLLCQAIVPLGRISYETDFKGDSHFIGTPSPIERVGRDDEGIFLRGEPVYFSLRTPRPFRQVRLTLEFDESEVPLIEVGVRRDKTLWSYELKPGYSRLLEELASSPNSLREGETMLWQATPRYQSVDEFLNNLPAADRIAVYRYPLGVSLRPEGALRTASEETIEVGLRGAFQAYTYTDGRPIRFSFSLSDRNENEDVDPIEFGLYRGAERVAEARLDDTTGSDLRTLTLESGSLEAGTYRLEAKVNNDIVTEMITTQQATLSFPGTIWLEERGRDNLKLYGDGQRFTAQTLNAASRQRIAIDKEVLELDATYEQKSFDTSDFERRAKDIEIKKDDIIIASDGVIAFSSAHLFNPTIRQLPPSARPSSLGADYAIARYVSPRFEEGGIIMTLDFNLEGAYREDGKYSFMISLPETELAEQPLRLRNIKAKLSEPNLIETMRSFLKRL